MTKLCTGCGEEKSVGDFSPRNGRVQRGPRGGLGLQPRCKTCRNAEFRRRRAANPGVFQNGRQRYKERHGAEALVEYDRRASLRKLYGITPEDYDAMLEQQGGCAICNGPPMGKGSYHVDHDHASGKIRGLLCHKCNVALGMVGDCVEHLDALRRYLELSA